MKWLTGIECMVFLLFLSACTNNKSNSIELAQKCAQEGGKWQLTCLEQEYRCIKPYKDAGKICSDSSECDGECIVDITIKCDEVGKCSSPKVPNIGEPSTGVCQQDNDPCGSFVIIRNGRVDSIIHRD